MANEITLSMSLAYSKDDRTAGLSFAGLQFDVSGNHFIHHVQTVGFAASEAIVLGEVATPGWIIGINHDDTNYVDVIGVTAETATGQAKAGEPFFFRFSSAAPHFQANTAACIVEYLLIED